MSKPHADSSNSPERQPLLSGESSPTVYSRSRSRSPEDEPAVGLVDQPKDAPVHTSRADLVWVLAGLWSAVFLGALDGVVVFAQLICKRELKPLRRDDCGYAYDAYWQLFREI